MRMAFCTTRSGVSSIVSPPPASASPTSPPPASSPDLLGSMRFASIKVSRCASLCASTLTRMYVRQPGKITNETANARNKFKVVGTGVSWPTASCANSKEDSHEKPTKMLRARTMHSTTSPTATWPMVSRRKSRAKTSTTAKMVKRRVINNRPGIVPGCAFMSNRKSNCMKAHLVAHKLHQPNIMARVFFAMFKALWALTCSFGSFPASATAPTEPPAEAAPTKYIKMEDDQWTSDHVSKPWIGGRSPVNA
mmetsp:Transcript_69865/g.137144  ORF Transcript_69865/g.137144 Transcript_69865/m.137144 type:complete len:251 (+) Transcript_69865:304-1056(+)